MKVRITVTSNRVGASSAIDRFHAVEAPASE